MINERESQSDRGEGKRKAEADLTPNERFWRDELSKHAVGSFVTFIVICGFLAPMPEAIDKNVMDAARLTWRCMVIVVATCIFIPWGVSHAVWIRCRKFDTNCKYDTVFRERTIRIGFFLLGFFAGLFLVLRAWGDLATLSDVSPTWKCYFWIIVSLGLVLLVCASGWPWKAESPNPHDRADVS